MKVLSISFFILFALTITTHGIGWNMMNFNSTINPRAQRGYDFGKLATSTYFTVNLSSPAHVHLISILNWNLMRENKDFYSYRSYFNTTFVKGSFDDQFLLSQVVILGVYNPDFDNSVNATWEMNQYLSLTEKEREIIGVTIAVFGVLSLIICVFITIMMGVYYPLILEKMKSKYPEAKWMNYLPRFCCDCGQTIGSGITIGGTNTATDHYVYSATSSEGFSSGGGSGGGDTGGGSATGGNSYD